MTEADEVAANLRPMYVAVFPRGRTIQTASRFVREWMENETQQVWDNVAESLDRPDRVAEQIRKDKHEHAAP